jgi:hypothetical protein
LVFQPWFVGGSETINRLLSRDGAITPVDSKSQPAKSAIRLPCINLGRTWLKQEKRTKEQLFDALVKNALGFVETSLDHVKKRPKNSIVDVYTAIELFLKARLMAEHCLMLSRAKQSYRVSPVSIPRDQRPAPSIRPLARFAVIELITVVEDRNPPSLDVDHEHPGIKLVPSLSAHSHHRAPPEDGIAQQLANLPCRE